MCGSKQTQRHFEPECKAGTFHSCTPNLVEGDAQVLPALFHQCCCMPEEVGVRHDLQSQHEIVLLQQRPGDGGAHFGDGGRQRRAFAEGGEDLLAPGPIAQPV